MNLLIKVWNFITGKKEIPPYPIPFALVVFTQEAMSRGIKDNQNKMIIHYFYNELNVLTQKVYPYSEQRVWAMENKSNIPVYDKTQGEERFPVHSKVLPQEITFMTK